MRLLSVLMMGAACSSCIAYLGPDDDPARAHSEYIVDQVFYENGYEGSDAISRKIKEKFQGFYYGRRTPEAFKAYLEKFGDQCEVRTEVVCTHRGYTATYIYTYFFDVPLGKGVHDRRDHLVRISFPKDGTDIIPMMTVETEKKMSKGNSDAFESGPQSCLSCLPST